MALVFAHIGEDFDMTLCVFDEACGPIAEQEVRLGYVVVVIEPDGAVRWGSLKELSDAPAIVEAPLPNGPTCGRSSPEPSQ